MSSDDIWKWDSPLLCDVYKSCLLIESKNWDFVGEKHNRLWRIELFRIEYKHELENQCFDQATKIKSSDVRNHFWTKKECKSIKPIFIMDSI